MPLSASFPELRALDLFVTVVEVGSVTRAARVHGITQPSASSRMTSLERQLGVVLLERGPTGTTPTPAGALVAGWAAAVLAAAHDLDVGVAAVRAHTEDRVRLAASFTIAEHLLPAWLGRFHRLHPEVAVELEVTNSAVVLAHLRAGTADLGFIESLDRADDLASVVVGTDRLVVVVAPQHPWARRRRPLGVEALSSTPLTMREAGSGTRSVLAAALADLGARAPIAAIELGSTNAVKGAVVAGGAPAVVSELAVRPDVATGRLVVVEVEGLDLARELQMVWPTHRTLTAPARRLRDHLIG